VPAAFAGECMCRGMLLQHIVAGPLPVESFLERLQISGRAATANEPTGTSPTALFDARQYNGFNLLSGDLAGGGGIYWHSNRAPKQIPHRLVSGVYGLSNHLLDTPWPKVVSGRTAFAQLVTKSRTADAAAWSRSPDEFFELLADSAVAPDDALPDTGVGLDKERFLSSRFIQSDVYGTRASSVLLVRRDGLLTFFERRFEVGGAAVGDSRYEFQIDGTDAA
ncbi:MAG: NRDE family protein, partial [Leptospirales bacterium]